MAAKIQNIIFPPKNHVLSNLLVIFSKKDPFRMNLILLGHSFVYINPMWLPNSLVMVLNIAKTFLYILRKYLTLNTGSGGTLTKNFLIQMVQSGSFFGFYCIC